MKIKSALSHAATILIAYLMAASCYAQSCTVGLGQDTTICAGGFLLTPNLSGTTFGDSLIITYNATQGQSGLTGAQKVYMHSAAEMVAFGGWQYPVGNWGLDDGIGQMTSIGQNLWQIRIHPESYYAYPQGSNPLGVFMVFRNADGSQTGKDNSGNDIYMDVSQDPPVSAFTGVSGIWMHDALDSIRWSDGSNGMNLAVTTTGNYWVAVTDTAGCTAQDTIVISQGSIPLVNLGQPTICDGNPVTLDAGSGFSAYDWSTGGNTQTITVSQGGIYLVTVTDAAGCSGTDVVNVPTLITPVAAFTTQSGSGLTLNFNVTAAQAQTDYIWDFNGDQNPDATTSGSTSHTYSNAGTYSVTLIVSNACGTDTVTQAVNILTNLTAQAATEGITIFPNPARNHVFVKIDLEILGSATIRLRDLKGKTLKIQEIENVEGRDRFQINLDEIATGMYLIDFEWGTGRIVRRLLRI